MLKMIMNIMNKYNITLLIKRIIFIYNIMDTFGIIMISVAFGVYGTYIAFCVYDICSYRCNNIKLCCKKLYCCKSNLPLDQNLVAINNDIRVPLTEYSEVILPTTIYNLDQ
jgi:hypothetical protein